MGYDEIFFVVKNTEGSNKLSGEKFHSTRISLYLTKSDSTRREVQFSQAPL